MNQPLRWLTLLLSWLLANVLGGALGGLIEARYEFMGTLILMGSTVGLCQWLLLRRQLPQAAYWGWVLALGWPLATFLWIALDAAVAPLIQLLITTGWLWEVFWLNAVRLLIMLGALGLVQGLAFLPRWQRLLGWWFASLAGGAVMGAVSSTACLVACGATTQLAGPLATGALINALGWGGYALITGPLLSRLSSPPQR